MKSLDITDAQFEAEVLKSDKPVLVDFWAPWCGPCRMIAPIVEELAETYAGKVKFVKVNVDDNPAMAGRFSVLSIPNLKLFKNGEVADEIIGAAPKENFEKILKAYA